MNPHSASYPIRSKISGTKHEILHDISKLVSSFYHICDMQICVLGAKQISGEITIHNQSRYF